jgi:hypothetical protein
MLEHRRVRGAQALGLPPPSSYVFASTVDGSAPMRPDTFTDRWAAARGSSSITLQHVWHYAATAMLDAGETT